MQNAQNDEYDEIWRAAQHRRTEDLSGWLRHPLGRAARGDVSQPQSKLRLGLARGMAIAIIAIAAITSVSAVGHAKKSPHVALRPTAPMPAVIVP
jgi:hypothetical protein